MTQLCGNCRCQKLGRHLNREGVVARGVEPQRGVNIHVARRRVVHVLLTEEIHLRQGLHFLVRVLEHMVQGVGIRVWGLVYRE